MRPAVRFFTVSGRFLLHLCRSLFTEAGGLADAPTPCDELHSPFEVRTRHDPPRAPPQPRLLYWPLRPVWSIRHPVAGSAAVPCRQEASGLHLLRAQGGPCAGRAARSGLRRRARRQDRPAHREPTAVGAAGTRPRRRALYRNAPFPGWTVG